MIRQYPTLYPNRLPDSIAHDDIFSLERGHVYFFVPRTVLQATDIRSDWSLMLLSAHLTNTLGVQSFVCVIVPPPISGYSLLVPGIAPFAFLLSTAEADRWRCVNEFI